LITGVYRLVNNIGGATKLLGWEQKVAITDKTISVSQLLGRGTCPICPQSLHAPKCMTLIVMDCRAPGILAIRSQVVWQTFRVLHSRSRDRNLFQIPISMPWTGH